MLNKAHLKNLVMSTNKLNGFYNGIVVDASDPLEQFRVRVEIPTLTKGLDPEHYPWYLVAQAPSSNPNSGANIPPVNSEVVVEFKTDDIYNGTVVYMLPSRPPA